MTERPVPPAESRPSAARPVGSTPPGSRFVELVAVMDRLRSPGGCPWDAEQTHASLAKYLLEEAYETIEAIETGDDALLREELGDVLLQVVFHARIAAERSDGWGIDDVVDDVVAKLIRRHPHVFGSTSVRSAAEVEANWDVLKAGEKQRKSVVDGIPLAQPALALAAALLRRARRAGIAVQPTPIAPPAEVDDRSIGDLLLAVVALAEAAGVDAESALREAARRLRDRILAAEEETNPQADKL
ncbi:MAG: MazG family protein [Acidothermus sp.]|nr:MazG family protein [Acidothermus sp.]